MSAVASRANLVGPRLAAMFCIPARPDDIDRAILAILWREYHRGL